MTTIASQITSLTIVYSTVYSGSDQSKHQSSASLAFLWGIHRGPVNSPHKWPVTRKMFPFDDVIMYHWFNSLFRLTTKNASKPVLLAFYDGESTMINRYFLFISRSGHIILRAWWHLARYRAQRSFCICQWKTTLQCKVASHWLGAYTKWYMTALRGSASVII